MTEFIQTIRTLTSKIKELESYARQVKDLYLGLLDRQKMLQGIVDQIPQGIIVTKDSAAVFANRKFAEIFGFNDPTEIISMETVETLFSPRAHAFSELHFEAIAQGPEISCPYSCEGQRRDGTPIWLEVTSVLGTWGRQPVTISTVQPLDQLGALVN